MMTNFQLPFSNFQLEATVWVVIKWMGVLGLLMYCLFAAVMIKQVSIMAQTIDDPANGSVKLVAWAHFVTAVIITIIMVVFL